MEALKTFLNMGGYAAWVWPCYGAATLALGGLLFFTLRTLKAREREFAALRRNRSEAPQ